MKHRYRATDCQPDRPLAARHQIACYAIKKLNPKLVRRMGRDGMGWAQFACLACLFLTTLMTPGETGILLVVACFPSATGWNESPLSRDYYVLYSTVHISYCISVNEAPFVII